MTSFDDPRPQIDALCSGLSDHLVRQFACACCRRVWHVIEDDRVHHALEVAERFASGDASPSEMDDARAEVSDAINVAALAEWEVEADAHFSYTPPYCEASARLCATLAVWYTLSRSMSDPDPDPDIASAPYLRERHKMSSWFWAAGAVEDLERAKVLRWIDNRLPGDPDSFNVSNTTARLHRIAEHREQLRIVAQLIQATNSHD